MPDGSAGRIAAGGGLNCTGAVAGLVAVARVAGRCSGGIGRGCGRVGPEGDDDDDDDARCDDDDDARVAPDSSAGRGEPRGEGVGGAIEGDGAFRGEVGCVVGCGDGCGAC